MIETSGQLWPPLTQRQRIFVDAASSRLRRRVEPATAIAGTLTQLSSGIGSQREYCERHGLSLKSFGNWRGQLKREDVGGRRCPLGQASAAETYG